MLKQNSCPRGEMVDTKDLKAEGFTSESVRGSPGKSKHPIKSHNFNLAFYLC